MARNTTDGKGLVKAVWHHKRLGFIPSTESCEAFKNAFGTGNNYCHSSVLNPTAHTEHSLL